MGVSSENECFDNNLALALIAPGSICIQSVAFQFESIKHI